MLKKTMKNCQMTQKKLQELTGIGQATISKIWNGKQKPTLKQAVLLEKFLSIPIEYWILKNDNEWISKVSKKTNKKRRS